MLAKRVQSFTTSEFNQFFDMAKSLKDPIDLSVGIPYANTSEPVKQAAIDAIAANHTRYIESSGLVELKDAVAEKLTIRNQIKAERADVIITAGVSGGLFLAMGALLNPGDEVLIADPFFLAYRELAVMLETKPVYVSTYPDFELTAAKIAPHITSKTKVLILNTPNNPSGKVYAKDSLAGIADLAQKHNLWIIADEVYEDFVYSGQHVSIGSLYPQTVTLNGFSKAYAMTGFRVGYAHAPAEVLTAMAELQQFVFFANSSIAQYAALAALKSSTEELINFHATARAQVLSELDPRYNIAAAEGTFFGFISHPTLNGQAVFEAAVKKGLIVVPGRFFSKRDSHFRISYSAPPDKLRRGLKLMGELLG